LPKIEAPSGGKALDRSRLEAQAPAGRPVRLSEDECKLVASRNERRQGPFRELGCSGEN
jgi:hypothetical protein